MISSGARGQVIATPGGTLGDLYGYGYAKAPEGSYILNTDGSRTDVAGQTVIDEYGYPVLSTDERIKMGNVQPDWRAGFSTALKYKGIRLSAAFAAQWGGMAYSLTNAQLSRQGKLTNTLYGRYGGVLHEGVVARGLDAQGNMVYNPNTTVTENVVTYYLDRVYSMNNVETSTFDTSYLKLRELRLEWTLPKNGLPARVCCRTPRWPSSARTSSAGPNGPSTIRKWVRSTAPASRGVSKRPPTR